MLKPFYKMKRGDYWHVKLKDRNGKAMTARSTRTKDKNEAEAIMWRWALEKSGYFIQQHPNYCTHRITPPPQFYEPPAPEYTEYEKMNLYDLLTLFWTYETSPLLREPSKGKKNRNPERFEMMLSKIKILQKELKGLKVKDTTAEKINSILLECQARRNLKPSTMAQYSAMFIQCFSFYYKKELIKKDIASKIIRFTVKYEEKPIFTPEETKQFFSMPELFASEKVYLLYKTLFLTGCRIGEILALQYKDIIKTSGGYLLNISKNWTLITHRIKSTKEERKDTVYISATLAEKLYSLNPTATLDDFIFSDVKTLQPLTYYKVRTELDKALKSIKIYRKGLTPHSFRHSFTVILRDKGYSEEDLLYLTRHDSRESMGTYLNHLSKNMKEKQKEAYHLMADVIT